MLGVVYLAVILAPVLVALALVVAAIARRATVELPPEHDEPASVTELRRPSATPSAFPSLPVGFRYDAIPPGPLQMVDAETPSTKVCPDCAETVLHSARVCKHCHFRFDPPLRGSHAV